MKKIERRGQKCWRKKLHHKILTERKKAFYNTNKQIHIRKHTIGPTESVIKQRAMQTNRYESTNRHTHMVGSVCSGAVIRKGGVHT